MFFNKCSIENEEFYQVNVSNDPMSLNSSDQSSVSPFSPKSDEAG